MVQTDVGVSGSRGSSVEQMGQSVERAVAPVLRIRWLGRVDYNDAQVLQHRLQVHSAEDHLLLLEHPHVVTLGRRGRREHLLGDLEARGATVVATDRGGEVTYHGPGQLVGYPILTVPGRRGGGMADTAAYVSSIEQMLIDVLGDLDLRAGRLARHTGVWIDPDSDQPRKIAAIGVRLSRSRSRHGFALNINPDLSWFDRIVPCGITGLGVTSLEREGVGASMRELVDLVATHAAAVWAGHGNVDRADVAHRLKPTDMAPFTRAATDRSDAAAQPASNVSSSAATEAVAEGVGVPAGTVSPGRAELVGEAAPGVPAGAVAEGVGVPAGTVSPGRAELVGEAVPGVPAGAVAEGVGVPAGTVSPGRAELVGEAVPGVPAGAVAEGVSPRLLGRLAQARVDGDDDGGVVPLRSRKPEWMRVPLGTGPEFRRVRSTLRSLELVTVCEEAGCPNISECWNDGTATFMILGERCTRACGFCQVDTRRPEPVDRGEPQRVAEAAARMELKYVVVTMVARDDLDDGGASAVVDTVAAVRSRLPDAQVETLISDLGGDPAALQQVFGARPDVLNHNIETVARLQRAVRPSAGYARSLAVLARAKDAGLTTKSSMIVGMGETHDEIVQTLCDLRSVGTDIVTLGQYLRPTARHLPVARWWEPAAFSRWKQIGESLGIGHVEASPLTRSSYHARQAAEATTAVP